MRGNILSMLLLIGWTNRPSVIMASITENQRACKYDTFYQGDKCVSPEEVEAVNPGNSLQSYRKVHWNTPRCIMGRFRWCQVVCKPPNFH